jgi:hypothetical protein
MKTAPTSEFQNNVFPLQAVIKNKDEKPLKVAGDLPDLKKADLPAGSPEGCDRPENWDESWFANYE